MSTDSVISLCYQVNAHQAMAGMNKFVCLLWSQGEPDSAKEISA